MDGIHDLGGKPAFGPVDRSLTTHPFERPWEGRVFAMINAAGRSGAYQNTDQFRHAIERIRPAHYFDHGYFGRWLAALELMLLESSLVSEEELKALPERPRNRATPTGTDTTDVTKADHDGQASSLKDLLASERNPPLPHGDARFSENHRVRTINQSMPGHTRLPAFARGRNAVIIDCHGLWPFPDARAHGLGPKEQHLYTVRLDRRSALDEGVIHLDVFELYLEDAS